jgi:hypothetical protein
MQRLGIGMLLERILSKDAVLDREPLVFVFHELAQVQQPVYQL